MVTGKQVAARVEEDWEDVLEELEDEAAETDSVTRLQIGMVLSAYDMNTPTNMQRAVKELSYKGIRIR